MVQPSRLMDDHRADTSKDNPTTNYRRRSKKAAKNSAKSVRASEQPQVAAKQDDPIAAGADKPPGPTNAPIESAREGESALWLDETQLEVRDITPEQAARFAEDEASELLAIALEARSIWNIIVAPFK